MERMAGTAGPMEALRRWSEAHDLALRAGILALAALVRGAFFMAQRGSDFFRFPLGDAGYYLDVARDWARTGNLPDFYPLHPFPLAVETLVLKAGGGIVS